MFKCALVAAVAAATVSVGTPAGAQTSEVDVYTSSGINETFTPGVETFALFRAHWSGPKPATFTISVQLPEAVQVTRTTVVSSDPGQATTTQVTENGVTTVTSTFPAAAGIFVFFVVPVGGPIEVPVTGTISSPEPDPDPTNNSLSQTIRSVPQVDVYTSSAINDTFTPGVETFALFRTHWRGPKPATFTISVRLPAAVQVTRTTVISGTPGQATTTQVTENGFTTVTSTYPAGAGVFVFFVVPVGGPTEVLVTGTISSPEYDPDPANNSLSQTIRAA